MGVLRKFKTMCESSTRRRHARRRLVARCVAALFFTSLCALGAAVSAEPAAPYPPGARPRAVQQAAD